MAVAADIHPARDSALAQRVTPSDLDDNALLAAIATQRDRAAYQELYARYERKAYSLARYLAGSDASADEAFQEGMLRVWIYAKSFKPDGNARAWILRTVAREALKKAKAARKDNRAMSLDESIQVPVLDAPERGNPEREELLAGLRESLERLAPGPRRLVLLYYVAGLTQQEIGQELSMPARTVSERLEQALKSLRSSLKQAGFAAAVPLLTAEGLEASLAGGPPPPPSLAQTITARLGERLADSMRAGPVTFGAGKVALAAVAVLAAVGAGLWWNAQQQASQNTPAAAPAEKTEQAASAPKETPYAFEWDFRKEGGPALEVLQGGWRWKKAPDTDYGAMLSDTENPTVVLVPGEAPAKPLHISGHTRMIQEGQWSLDALLLDGNQHVPNRIWSRYLSMLYRTPAEIRSERAFDLYLFEQYVVAVYEGQAYKITEYPRPYPSGRLALAFKDWAVLDVTIREITLDEIPAELRDVPKLIEASKMKPDPQPEGMDEAWKKFRSKTEAKSEGTAAKEKP